MPTERKCVETVAGLLSGDEVKVTGEPGATFRFRSAVIEIDGGMGEILWVNLYGGRPHHEKLRSVAWDRLKIPTDKQLARQRRIRSEAS